MDDCHIIGWQRKLRHKHILLTVWTCSRFSSMTRPSPPETIKMKLPSTLPVGVEPVLRSSACSPSLPRKLVRWVGRRCAACTHQWLIGGNEMAGWIDSRSYADCHKFINEHDDELVREVLKYYNSELLRHVYLQYPGIHQLQRISGSSNNPSAPTFPSKLPKKCVQKDPKRSPTHPPVHLLHPLPHPPTPIPPHQAPRDLRPLQHRSSST